jgi:uncharacterized protein YecT (DUF1311 family)
VKFLHSVAALLSLVVMPLAAHAADCSHPSGGPGMSSAQASFQCAEQVRIQDDQQLDGLYNKLLVTLRDDPRLHTHPREDLTAAHRAWLAYRNAECQFRISLASGAPQWAQVNHSQCLSNLTEARIKTLADYLQQAQGE